MQWKFDSGDEKNMYFLCFSIAIWKENCGILSHFQASGNAESQELPGDFPTGPPPGHCPGPAGGL